MPTLKKVLDLKSIGAGVPLSIKEDSLGNIWVATDYGLVVCRTDRDKLAVIKVDIHDISSMEIDTRGAIWLGTHGHGLYRIVPEYRWGEVVKYTVIHFNAHNSTLLSDNIETLCSDVHRRKIWIGTTEGYVQAWDIATNKAKDYSPLFYSYINASIYDIITGKEGHIWVSTAKNVIEFSPDNEVIKSYAGLDDTGIHSFERNACFYYDGVYYYGRDGGITGFKGTSDLAGKAQAVDVDITDVRVSGKSILDGGFSEEGLLDIQSRKLVLGPDAHDIEIDFSTLNYSSPRQVLYAYRIKGVNNDWVYTGNNLPRAYYNKLPKGESILELRATDSEGRWSAKTVSYLIERKPAFYETWWAYVIYVFLCGILAYCCYRWAVYRVRLRNELKIIQIEKEKGEELTQAKLRYFTNISHDFLTPITIISCLIDDMVMTYKNRIPQLDKMRSSLRQLKHLIQQVLDFRKIENGKMSLQVSEGDISVFIEDLCRMNFSVLMDKKHITFAVVAEKPHISACFDRDILEKVLYNLLFNAYKYTNEGGEITVSLSVVENDGVRSVLIRVKDTGVGIPLEKQPFVFNRFYTATTDTAAEANGIGLSLVKELLEIHHGRIALESTVGKGTEFSVLLPMEKSAYLPEEFAPQEDMSAVEELELPHEENIVGYSVLEKTEPQKEVDGCMLLVDDNVDLLDVMCRVFSHRHKVLLAHDGIEAVAVIENNAVDVIISDVMMPNMDGLELCRHLKADINTSHIPVILLTAKNAPEDRIECYKAGCDGYVAKPFELRVLEARVESFLEHKRCAQRDFKEEREVRTAILKMSALDQKFLDKVISIIEHNMKKAIDIDVNTIAREVGMSKSSFYRKIKLITDLSPVEFVKNIRLKHAYELLEKGETSLESVAYSTGFSSAKYFSTCFKEQFGITPTEFLRRRELDV